MTDPIETMSIALAEWSHSAATTGWLKSQQMPVIPAEDQHTPAELFDQPERPLVVSFFGGTGVGKSSLLNRLADQPIATASAVRPTSREITLYYHHEVEIGKLPDELPIDRISKATHSNDQFRQVLWIDMPDFDSIETSNHALVSDWLPHIDMLVYVVSPERYRDDTGWRLLLKHAQRHAWVFVINHWDRGVVEQRDSFRSQLETAGLHDPLIFCTDSSAAPDKPNGDEFSEFAEAIQHMAHKRFIQGLEEHGVLVRLKQSFVRLEDTVQPLRATNNIPQIASSWQTDWQASKIKLTNSLEWKFRQLAEPFGALDQSLPMRLFSWIRPRKQEQQITLDLPDQQQLVDQPFIDAVVSGIDAGIQKLVADDVPLNAARMALQPVTNSLGEPAAEHIRQSTEQSLARPGTPLQRKASAVLRALCILLPVGVLLWAVYQLVSRFHTSNPVDNYLGFSFATHTLMLTFCAWLIPWLTNHYIRPTHKQAALTGMRQGINQFLDTIEIDTLAQFDELDRQRQTLIDSAAEVGNVLPQHLRKILLQTDQRIPPDSPSTDPQLSRVLVTDTTRTPTT